MTTPRPECELEPCLSWFANLRRCGHESIYGVGTCILDDPERREAWEKRMERKRRMGK